MRYVVDVVGETTWEPFNATVVPFKSALTAFFVVQVRVEPFPATMEVGIAVIPAAGGPPDVTVTVVWAVAVAPDELVAMKV